jgi:hypothetical protein
VSVLVYPQRGFGPGVAAGAGPDAEFVGSGGDGGFEEVVEGLAVVFYCGELEMVWELGDEGEGEVPASAYIAVARHVLRISLMSRRRACLASKYMPAAVVPAMAAAVTV